MFSLYGQVSALGLQFHGDGCRPSLLFLGHHVQSCVGTYSYGGVRLITNTLRGGHRRMPPKDAEVAFWSAAL